MRYLIDGHNLIARLPDIDLSDPDDEAKLVFKLRSFVARTGSQVTVVFDGGLPGGISETLSTSSVTAIFASESHSTADKVLLGVMRKIKNPRAYTLVSSDQEILGAAQGYGMPVMTTAGFIVELSKNGAAESQAGEKDENPRLTPAELEEWLAIFSGDEE